MARANRVHPDTDLKFLRSLEVGDIVRVWDSIWLDDGDYKVTRRVYSDTDSPITIDGFWYPCTDDNRGHGTIALVRKNPTVKK